MNAIEEWTQLKAQCEDVLLTTRADTEGYDIVVSMYADMKAIEMGVKREHPHEEITLFVRRLCHRRRNDGHEQT